MVNVLKKILAALRVLLAADFPKWRRRFRSGSKKTMADWPSADGLAKWNVVRIVVARTGARGA